MNIKTALKAARTLFTDSDSAQLDSELLLAFVLGKSRTYLFTWPEQALSEEQNLRFQQFCQRRQKGHPIAYLLGQRSFWDFDLYVNQQVLIPRPETELLVELTLEKLGAGKKLIADLGTGSGAIALALANERPAWDLLACDISEQALEVAKANLDSLKLNNVEIKQGAWCAAFPQMELDAIVSNPPYIDAEDKHLSEGDVRFEPELALISANKGLADIEIIATEAQSKLKQQGWLLLEHGYQQGEAVRAVLKKLSYTAIATHKDLAANDRVTCAQLIK